MDGDRNLLTHAMFSIQGEYRFSCLEQPPPPPTENGDIRLSGQDLQAYMEKFVELFLPDRIRYNTEVLNIRPTARGGIDPPRADNHVWTVMMEDVTTKVAEIREYDKLILCTGVRICCLSVLPGYLLCTNRAAASLTTLWG